MSNLKRWPDDGAPPEVARLLSAGLREYPKRDGLQRALLAVGVTGAASTVASVTSAASTAAGGSLGAGGKIAAQGLFGLVAKWSAIGALGAGAVAGVVSGVEHYRSTGETPAVLVVNGSNAEVRRSKAEPVLVPVNEPQPRASAPVTVVERTPAPARSSRVVALAPSASNSALMDRAMAREIGLIDQARATLRAGNAAGTLQSVVDYNRQFPAGRFAPEALYLKMEAYSKLGDKMAASAVARRIIGKYPQGPQVGRAKEVLGISPR